MLYLLSTDHERHSLNVLGVVVKSGMDSFDILKSWLECGKKKPQTTFPGKQELKHKGNDCKVTSYCISADGQQLAYWVSLTHGLLI